MKNQTKIPLKHLLHVINSLLCLLFILFLSCNKIDEPEGLKLKNRQIDIEFEDSVKIGATSGYDISYSVRNPFIASVENGFIKARHVGSTYVMVNSNDEIDSIEVNVRPHYELFRYPIDSYLNGREYYDAKHLSTTVVLGKIETNVNHVDDYSIEYLIRNYTKEVYFYIMLSYTVGNTLNDVVLTFNESYYSQVFHTLIGCYDIHDFSEDIYTFINAFEISKATEIVTLSLDDDNCYVKYEQLK